jgi:hypothetical protein
MSKKRSAYSGLFSYCATLRVREIEKNVQSLKNLNKLNKKVRNKNPQTAGFYLI